MPWDTFSGLRKSAHVWDISGLLEHPRTSMAGSKIFQQRSFRENTGHELFRKLWIRVEGGGGGGGGRTLTI